MCRLRSSPRSDGPISSATPRRSRRRARNFCPRGRSELADLRSFVVAKQIATIPGDEQALVAEAPPYNRGNFAYINIPGPYDKGVASTYNIAPPDPSWSAKERAEYIPGVADLLFTSVHEVWPGHFLQFLHANRNPSKIGR